jgi:hypothetical protein
MATSRLAWIAAAGAIAVFCIVPGSTARSQLRASRVVPEHAFSGSVGAVSASVIAAWRARGAENGEGVRVELLPTLSLAGAQPLAGRTGRPPDDMPPPTRTIFEREWMLDLLVLWRWPGRAPEMTDGGGSDSGPGLNVVPYRIAVEGGRELRVEHDIEAETVRLNGAARVVELAGANVLMLDVGEHEARVAGTATIPRFAVPDAVEAAKAASGEVAAFVGSW